jgi:PAS domain S-box-containing protein
MKIIRQLKDSSLIITGFSCLVTVATSLVIWQALVIQQNKNIKNQINEISLNINQVFTNQIRDRVESLKRIAKHWEDEGKTDQILWEKSIEDYLEQYSGFQAIQWIDDSYKVRWIVPLQGNEAVKNIKANFDETRNNAIEKARNNRDILITSSLDLKQGGKGFILYIPLFINLEKEERFDGFIAGVFKYQKLIDSLLDKVITSGLIKGDQNNNYELNDFFQVSILENNQIIYQSDNYDLEPDFLPEWSQDSEINVYGETWKIRITPRSSFIKSKDSHLPEVILALGLLMSLLFSWTIYVTQKSKQQTNLLSSFNQELTSEIHKRKQLESELEHFFNLSLDIFCVANFQGYFKTCNPALSKILGYNNSELLSQSFLRLIHPDDQNNTIAEINKLTTGQSSPYFENRYRCKDHSYKWLAWTGVPVLEERLIYFVARDITERKNTEQELQESLQKEKYINELRTRIMTTISHEFRTPLTTILGSVELIKYYEDKLGEDKKQDYLNKIHDNVHQLTEFLDDLLLFGKAESDKLELNLSLINLDIFCQDLIEELKVGNGTGHQIILTCHGDNFQGYFDPKILRNIINNLLINSIKYSAGDTIINLDLFAEPNQVKIRIEDRGFGIPQPDQAQLFQSFYRGTNVGNIKGTGLGLPIVKKAVELYQGKIEFSSTINVGTVFTVTLPLRLSQSESESIDP